MEEKESLKEVSVRNTCSILVWNGNPAHSEKVWLCWKRGICGLHKFVHNRCCI